MVIEIQATERVAAGFTGRTARYRRGDDGGERMIPADRITNGIIYKTHFADWEKPGEPVSARETDATRVGA